MSEKVSKFKIWKCITEMFFQIPPDYRNLFPSPSTPFILNTKDSVYPKIETRIDKAGNIGANLKPWFRQHLGQIERGTLFITIIEHDNKREFYLEIVK